MPNLRESCVVPLKQVEPGDFTLSTVTMLRCYILFVLLSLGVANLASCKLEEKKTLIAFPDARFAIPEDWVPAYIRMSGSRPWRIDLPCSQLEGGCGRQNLGGASYVTVTPVFEAAEPYLSRMARIAGDGTWHEIASAKFPDYRIRQRLQRKEQLPVVGQRIYQSFEQPSRIIECTEYQRHPGSEETTRCRLQITYVRSCSGVCTRFWIGLTESEVPQAAQFEARYRSALKRYELIGAPAGG